MTLPRHAAQGRVLHIMARSTCARRGVATKTVVIVIVLILAVLAAGISLYKSFLGKKKASAVDQTESLGPGQFMQPEAVGEEGQQAKPQGESP